MTAAFSLSMKGKKQNKYSMNSCYGIEKIPGILT